MEYRAEVKEGRMLQLPVEAELLRLKPGDEVIVELHVQGPPSGTGLKSILGRYAFVPGGSETFAQEKSDEILREDGPRG